MMQTVPNGISRFMLLIMGFATLMTLGCTGSSGSTSSSASPAASPAHVAYSVTDLPASSIPTITMDEAIATVAYQFELPEAEAVGAAIDRVVPQESADGITLFVYYSNGVEVAIQPTSMAMNPMAEAEVEAEVEVGSGRFQRVYRQVTLGSRKALAHEPFEQLLGGSGGPKNKVPAVVLWQAESTSGVPFINYTVYGAEGMRMADVIRIANTMRLRS